MCSQPDKPTGGIRRLFEMHALIPRLGLFQGDQSTIPYDYDDLLKAIAPRPTLLYTPQSDRDAKFSDVDACVSSVKGGWDKLTHGKCTQLQSAIVARALALG